MADGTEFARATVTVTTLGQEFVRGVSGEVTLPDFPQVGADVELRWQEAQQNFVILSAAPTRRQVLFRPSVNIPTGVTSVQAGNVSVTSLSSSTAEVQASPAPTLLLGEDTDGTVLLSIADMDGGLLGESSGRVEASIDSTAVTLVALTAGVAIHAIDQSLIDDIQAHAQYPALRQAMIQALQKDKNFLDRIITYPEVVRLIRQVAAALQTPAAQALSELQWTASAQTAAVLPAGERHDNFVWWSDWDEHEPWRWFGETALLPTPPFLANSLNPEFRAFHATGNPNYVGYALELYTQNAYQDWLYIPGNSSLWDKTNDSGAAQRLITVGPRGSGYRLNPDITQVRFARYRLSGDTTRATIVSFINTFKLVFSVVHLLMDVEAITLWLDGLAELDPVHEAVAGCVVDLVTGLRLPDNTAGDAKEQARRFFTTNVGDTVETSLECILKIQIVRLGAGEILKDLIHKAILTAVPKLAAKTSNPAGWVVLVLEGVNTTVPVVSSYFLPTAGDVEYGLEWTRTPDGTPYIVRVSEQAVDVTPLPAITSVSNASATEGSNLTFTVQLSGNTTRTETYYYSTYSGGSAPAEQGDYAEADEQAVQVPSGRSSFTIQVRANQDADSDDETFYLYVRDAGNHPSSTPGSSQYRGTGTIRDDDSAPDLVVGSPSVSVNPLTTGQAFTLSVTVRNRGTEASPGTTLRYYRSSDATITRQDTQRYAGQIGGVNPSSTRTASASLTAPSTAGTYYYGACVDGVTDESDTTNNCSSGVRVTVGEATTKPDISSVGNASATEGNTLTFTVQLSGSTTQRETYYYSAYNGTAESGDYAAADEQTVQVSSGNSSFTISVRTNQDADTDDETFYLYVTSEANHPNSAPGSSQYRATGTIRDDDSSTDDHGNTRSGATSLSVSGSQSGQMETGNDVDYFRVQVSGSGELTVYTTGSLDTVGTLENSSGSSLSNDDNSGNGSNFRIAQTVSAGTYYVKVESHGSNTGSYTLHASFSATSPTPQVSIADASATEGNSLSFTVTLSPAPTQSTTYYYATYQGTARGGGQDYQGSYATALTFSSGQTSKTISVSTIDDTEDESDEQFYVYITDASSKHPNSGTPSDYLDSATGTIRDNDDTVTPQVSIANASATEGNTLNFTVTLSPAPTQSVTYYYATYQSTARGGGQDYQGHYATALTFSSGQTSKTISVSTIDDTEDESDEQFYVYITDASSKHPNSGTPSDYLDSATGTIRDNDDTTPTSPDLIVSSASLDDTTVEQGDRIRIDVTIRNQGDGRAGSSRVGYYTTINGSLTLLDYDSVSSLNAGSSADEYERLSTSDLTPGTYCIGVRADYRKRVDESDETNNNYTSSNLCFTVTTPALPDLIVSSASLDDTTVEQGDRIRIDVTVKNQGDGRAGSSRVGYYTTINGSLTLLDYDSVSSLNAGSSADEYERLSTSSLSPGTYCIGVRADYQKSVDESDETNNNYASLDTCFTVTAP